MWINNLRRHAMSKIPFLLSLMFFSLVVFGGPSHAASKFECPNPFKPSNPATLAEINSQLPDRKAMADVGRLTATINVLRLKRMPRIQIIDHLIGTYCPMVAQEDSFSEAEKQTSVRRFSGQVTRLVYSLESGLDVVINVPFTPDVVEAINAKALKQGLSVPAFISMTVENALELQ
jgi:S-methylmethionine-dependent homocysteine/selenocysteine methylase